MCHFGKRSTLVLGFLVDKDGIRPDGEKIAPVHEFSQPKTVEDLRSFLDLCSYFHQLIKNFAEIAHPLTCLLHKDNPYVWTTGCEDTFRQLKYLLTSGPVLRHFDPEAMTELYSDASGVGVGAVLIQLLHGRQHVVA